MVGEGAGHRRRGREPEVAARESGGGRDEVGGELFRKRMDHEARVAVGELAEDGGVFFLVAADGAHRGQAARDGVRARRNGRAEGKVSEGGHAKDGKLRAES